MITSEFDVTINGVNYHIAEDAEGEGYVMQYRQLRAPNAQIVQGSDAARVNINPDTLIWSWDDWSDGEGQVVFDPTQPGRSYVNQATNFMGRPGNVFGGYKAYTALNAAAGNFIPVVGLVVARGVAYAVEVGSALDDFYVFDGTDFDAAVSIGSTDGARSPLAITGDRNYLFFVVHNTDDMWRWDGSTWAKHNDRTGTNSDTQLEQLGDFVYKLDSEGKVYELSKVTANLATVETAILDFSAQGTIQDFENKKIVAGWNRVYVLATYDYETVLYEITPTSAAQTGFGRELARFTGLKGESIWHQGGFIYWTGIDNEADASVGARRVLYYLQPGASWGTLGEVRSFVLNADQPIPGGLVMGGAGRLNTSAFVVAATYEDSTEATEHINLFEVDAISGGFGALGEGNLGLSGHYECVSLVFFKGKYLAAMRQVSGGTNPRVTTWNTEDYNNNQAFVVSPQMDFGIAATKVLQSIELVTEPLPTGSPSVIVSYKLDGGSWTSVGTYGTDGGTGQKVVISTDSTLKSFRSMQIRIGLNNTDALTSIVKAVNVRATVNERFRVWTLMLDATDETSPRGLNGAALISNLTSLGQDTVVEFSDGYQNRNRGVFNSHDVVVENVVPLLTQPGEGRIQVTLREVV